MAMKMFHAPSGTFLTADKPINIAAKRDAQWVSLTTHIGRWDLLEHADYKTREQRKKNRTALRLEIEKVLVKRPAKEWV